MIHDISSLAFINEEQAVKKLLESVEPLVGMEPEIMKRAVKWTHQIRENGLGHGVEAFLNIYGLNTNEGIALMCLAEALLRIPDTDTANALIRDTFEGRDWDNHTAGINSWMISFSSWGLFLTGKTIDLGNNSQAGILRTLKKLIARTGEPVIREALKKAMRIIGGQFVLGETMKSAISSSKAHSKRGYRFSYDILGEGARSNKQALKYVSAYQEGIETIGKSIKKNTPLFEAPNISIKLSALHPRYQLIKREQLMKELLPRITDIMLRAKQAEITISIDAEESSRLDIEMELFAELLKHPELAKWNGIGFVLQAYQKRAFYIIDWLAHQAHIHNKIIPIRLVKGAYWDSEIKWGQVQGLLSYPVFTRKEHTDLSYIACANKILSHRAEFYPQFATHNARSIARISCLSEKYNWEKGSFEFQRLHGMGEALHDIIIKDYPSRIYAPVGAHKDLLAYLIRRLLENSANSSFVHLLMDSSKTNAEILADPIATIKSNPEFYNSYIPAPKNLYKPHHKNSSGVDFGNNSQLEAFLAGVNKFTKKPIPQLADNDITSLNESINTAKNAFQQWAATEIYKRAKILERCADLLENNSHELIALCAQEAGKTLQDGVAEIREAIEFCRYYATEAHRTMTPISLNSPTGESNILTMHPRGIFACISPWNFPLAIFMGQVSAALVTGNCVIAKPAEQTTAIAARTVELLYEAGIPREVLHLIIGKGETIGAAIVANKDINGIVFTGSTETAHHIQKSLVERGGAIIPLIAETGGQNCMLVDSSALLEQAIDDIIISAFSSAGQRCSSLRVLYVQDDIADKLIELLAGAMQELKVGNPLELDTDIGSVIDIEAKTMLLNHISHMKNTAKFIAATPIADDLTGNFVAPHAFEINNINELEKEIFGPVLHVIRFKENKMEDVIDEINSTGYGLTFGIHSRINEHINLLTSKIIAGNIYVNRSMIGATVGVQPFGGEGLSGTGFKAGGPHYLLRFLNERNTTVNIAAIGGNVTLLAGE